ncbi:MAG: hypothetical protein MJ210_03585, partial [Alphaproteobacteria bacterium]|nr:hypothetical protein [Alphaproteobacteria bacterium]
MSRHHKNKSSNKYDERMNLEKSVKEEKTLSAEIATYLQVLFGRRYEDKRKNAGGKKDRGVDGKKKELCGKLSPADMAKIKTRIIERLIENGV